MRTKHYFYRLWPWPQVSSPHRRNPMFIQRILWVRKRTNPAGSFIMIANPLDNGTNDLTGLLSAAPNGSRFSSFKAHAATVLKRTRVLGAKTCHSAEPAFSLIVLSLGTKHLCGQRCWIFPTGIPAKLEFTILAGSPIPFAGTLATPGRTR